MLLKARNLDLTRNAQKTFLTAAVSAAGTTLTVKDNTGFLADNQYIMLGEPGQDGTEVVQANGAGSAGTSITIDDEGSGGCDFAHEIGTPVYAIDFNQVVFYHATSTSAAKTTLATQALTPDHEFSQYEDTAYSSGYYYIRFKNATSSAYSNYSDAVPFTGYVIKSLYNLIKKTRRLIDEESEEDGSQISDETITEELNDKQRDIAHDRLWPFYEATKSLSQVADQFKYDLASDVNKLFFVAVETRPLAKITKNRWQNLHWDSDTEGNPTHAGYWDDALWIYPRPSESAGSTTLGAAISSTTATTITVASSSDFKRGDYYRFIIDDEVIYATESTSTTFTGCLRGQEGTTAATHSNGATVTERDIVYHFHEEPTDLADMSDETKIPEPMVLAYGAAMELALKKNDQNLHDRMKAKYELAYNRLREKYAEKSEGIMIVKDVNTVVTDEGAWEDPNNHPQNLA